MSWSESVREKTETEFKAILELPFIKELAAGTLPGALFSRYMEQDEIYLGVNARQMKEYAALLKNPSDRALFEAFAASSLESETDMHALLSERFGIKAAGAAASRVTEAYCAHTQAAIDSGGKEVALAALLPCLWVYNMVGLHILGCARLDGNPYREWIEAYGDEAFSDGVRQVLEMVDAMAENGSEELRSEMDRQFSEAVELEYAFWDYAYYGESGDYSYIEKYEH